MPTTYLVEDLLQMGSSHAVSQVSVSRVGKEELALSSQGCSDVLLPINVLLAPVHNSNVAYKRTAPKVSFRLALQHCSPCQVPPAPILTAAASGSCLW